MSVTSTRRSFTPIWSMRFLKRSWVIGLGSLRFSIPAAIAFASSTPIQIGRVFRFSLSRNMTMVDWVTGSIVIPITCISLTMQFSFLAREGMMPGRPDRDATQCPFPVPGGRKVDGLVARSPAAQARGVLHAFPLDQHLHHFPDARGQAFPGVEFLQGLEAIETLSRFRRGYGSRHAGSAGPRSRGEPEKEGGIVPDFLHDRQRLPEIFLRLAREPDDEIRRECDPGPRFSYLFDPPEIFLSRVPAPQGGQDPVRPRLDRQMDMRAKEIDLGKKADRLPVQVPRMRGKEPYSPDSPDSGYPPEEFGERDLPLFFPVGVHVLPQEDHVAYAPVRQFVDLRKDLPGGPADLASADIRDDAIGAVVVASLHDGHHGARRSVRKIREHVPVAGVAGEVGGNLGVSTFREAKESGQPGDAVRAEHDVDVRRPLPHFRPLLLGEAPPHGDESSLTALLPSPKMAQGAVDLLVRLLPDAAGVQKHEIGIGQGFRGAVISLPEERHHPGRVHLVHLAAECLDVYAPDHSFSL